MLTPLESFSRQITGKGDAQSAVSAVDEGKCVDQPGLGRYLSVAIIRYLGYFENLPATIVMIRMGLDYYHRRRRRRHHHHHHHFI